ncbi:MAG TPA: asparagine--tRNA ligase [Candidatus Kerfeldbacteria bacterium]|nr:asparagine--tRNA ligase [Candidatus Kerfeldbacteria bacterium]
MAIFICDFPAQVGQTVTVQGWVYNLRSSGKILFLQIRDGSGFTQAIVNQAAVSTDIWAKAASLTLESSVVLTGTVSKHPKKEEYELQVTGVEPIQVPTQEFPIGKKDHGPDFLLEHRHLWLRSPKQWAIQRIRNSVINATYQHLNSQHFIKIDAPILTPNSCESVTELFQMDYFDIGKAYLTQSGQLYIEAAIFSHGRVFDFGPVFRAEKSKTRRHLTEFWMMDAEMAFVDYQGSMDIQEALIKAIVQYVLEHNQEELTILERDTKPLQTVLAKPFVRIAHQDAVKELHKLGSDIKEDDDLGADDETMITNQHDVPVFVMKYPAKVKAFYMQPDPADPAHVLCSDLLAPEGYGEIIGGSQRIHDFDLLAKKLDEYKLPRAEYEWYLDLRRYGSVPHSGFGYGLERITGWLSGTKHIRETIPFPRLINRIYP